MKGFDGHLIIQGLKQLNFENIDIIAQNFKKYMTISFSNIQILDSFAFLSSSLDTLSANLLKEGVDMLENLNPEQLKLRSEGDLKYDDLCLDNQIIAMNNVKDKFKHTLNNNYNDEQKTYYYRREFIHMNMLIVLKGLMSYNYHQFMIFTVY